MRCEVLRSVILLATLPLILLSSCGKDSRFEPGFSDADSMSRSAVLYRLYRDHSPAADVPDRISDGQSRRRGLIPNNPFRALEAKEKPKIRASRRSSLR